MAKRKMFKMLARLEEENIGHTGGSYALAFFQKEKDSMVSAYLDKVRVSFIAKVTDTHVDATPPLEKNIGYMFWLSTSASSEGSDYVLSASATRGNGGTVVLPADRRILENDENSDTGFGRIYLWVRTTNPDLAAGDITIEAYIEAFGRWHVIGDA